MVDDAKMSIVARARSRLGQIVLRQRIRAATRLAGGSGFEFWATMSDRMLEADPPNVQSGTFVDRAELQLNYLKSLGLEPQHMFLDYGCSILRTARYLVPYLETGHYVGADVSRYTMRAGTAWLRENGIARHRYHLANVRGPRLIELDGFRFDFIFANSVVQYLSDDELAELLASFRGLLKRSGRVFVSFPDDCQMPALRAKGQYFREPERMLALAAQAGLCGSWQPARPEGFPWARHMLLSADTRESA